MNTAPPSRKGQKLPADTPDPNRPIPPELDRRQAFALQRLVWQRFVTIDALPPDSLDFDLHERAVSLLCKLADAWQSLVSTKRELRGIPRVGQLSPAERADMRRRKASKSSRAAPKLSAKESLSAPAPSGRSGAPGGAAGETITSGVPSLTGSGWADVPKVSESGGAS